MNTKTVAIIGGSQKRTSTEIGKKEGYEVIFHDGKGTRNKTNEFKKIIEKADFIIVMLGAISHQSMWEIKRLAKKEEKKVLFHKGFGISGAFNKMKLAV